MDGVMDRVAQERCTDGVLTRNRNALGLSSFCGRDCLTRKNRGRARVLGLSFDDGVGVRPIQVRSHRSPFAQRAVCGLGPLPQGVFCSREHA